MRTSAVGLKKIAVREGTILHVYKDSKGLPTAGVGHLILPSEKASYPVGKKITQSECDTWLTADLKECEDAVNRLGVSLKQHEFDALVSLAFNIGVGGFAKSTVARRLKAGDKAGAAEAIMMWKKPSEIQGRRRTEYNQFTTPYKTSATAPQKAALQITTEDLERTPSDTAGVDISANSVVPATGNAPESPAFEPPPVIEVESVVAEPENKIDATLKVWSARFVAVPAAGFTFLAGAWAWVKDSPTNLVITISIVFGAIAVTYVLSKQVTIALDKSREDRLKAQREQRAFELQKLTLESAADPSKNAVRIVNPPATEILNSDSPEPVEENV